MQAYRRLKGKLFAAVRALFLPSPLVLEDVTVHFASNLPRKHNCLECAVVHDLPLSQSSCSMRCDTIETMKPGV
jgi:hypothetical protein